MDASDVATEEVTIARNYADERVVIELSDRDRAAEMPPSAARKFAATLKGGGRMPGMDEAPLERLADEISDAADDVEDA